MNFSEYKDKVYGCFLGKNIGGTLGGPFEGKRGFFDISYYTHDLKSGVLPNDDLDLQLVFLNAAERYGTAVDAKILGDYWQLFITAHWSEYGAGKANMKRGLTPPLSGAHHNAYKDSCGAFIRSELWACLMPGCPEEAVKYAFEDAIQDHADEGVYGEIFCAAIESAAFVVSDVRKLVDIALTYIPADCGVAKGINTVLSCYDAKKDAKECRKAVLNAVPGSFGMLHGYGDRQPETDVAVGKNGYDAPGNVALMVLGLIYGEGDFDKTICLTVACGEDADCTGATVGSLYGIIHGASAFPEKWLTPIGDEIKTISVDTTDGYAASIPKTLTDLCARITRLMPTFMRNKIDFNTMCIIPCPEAKLYNIKRDIRHFEVKYSFSHTLSRSPECVHYSFFLFDVDVRHCGGALIRSGEEKHITLSFIKHINRQSWLSIRWFCDEGLSVAAKVRSLYLEYVPNTDGYGASSDFLFTLEGAEKPKYTAICEITNDLTGEVNTFPVTLING